MRKLLVAAAMACLGQAALAQEIVLAWDPNPERDLVGYLVYRSETSGTGYDLLTPEPVAFTEYHDRTVKWSTTYFYVVTAINAGGLESSHSNEVSAHLGPVFPHFVGGAGIGSTLILQNPSLGAVDGRLDFLSSEGTALTLEVNGAAIAGTLDFEIPGRGRREFNVTAQGPLLGGSARIQSSTGLGGLLLLSGVLGDTAVSASAPLESAMIPVEWNDGSGLSTGIAIANPGTADATVDLLLRNTDGVAVAELPAPIVLEAGHQLARFPQEALELAAGQWPLFKGSLEVRSDRPVSLLGLRLTSDGLVALPVTGIDPSALP